MTDTKACRDCGAQFERSPADVTVRCPDCRARVQDAVQAPHVAPETCYCGKTVIVDGFGGRTGNVCPRDCAPSEPSARDWYRRGWRYSRTSPEPTLEHGDRLGYPTAWYWGYEDDACGRPDVGEL